MCLAKISITNKEGENRILGPTVSICYSYFLSEIANRGIARFEVMSIFKVLDKY